MATRPQIRGNWVKAVRSFAWTHFPRNPRLASGLWALAVFGLGLFLLAASLTPGRYLLRADQISPEDILATRTIVDREASEKARQVAAAQVPDQYGLDPRLTAEAEAAVAAVFAAVREAGATTDPYGDRAVDLAADCAVYGITLSQAAVSAALGASPTRIDFLEAKARAVVETVMQGGVKSEYLEAARAQAATEFSDLGLPSGETHLLRSIAEAVIVPNMEFNAAATQTKREAAMAAVPTVEILKGQVILRAGEMVTADDLSILQDLGLLRNQPAWGALLGLSLIMLLLEAAVGLYLYLFDPGVLRSGRRLSLLCLLALLTMGLAAATGSFSGYFIPVAAGAMLTAILLDVRLATFMCFVIGPFVGLLAGNDLRFTLVAMAGGLAGVFAVSRLGQRKDLMRAGLIVAFVNAVAIIAVDNLGGRGLFDVVGMKDALWGVGNGLVSAVLTIGCLPFLEDVFGVLTSVKLLELADPNQPLLRRLLMEAPGTYHHSIIVGNLAEAAAAEVGGRTALARVGAYYHDIGKSRRPYFFVDNQFGGDNPHDKIAPSLSALIITSHVRDGVAMAEEAGLPEEVVDLIRQHHGNALVSYFYSRAAETTDPESIVEADFRYDGPQPASREAAILMLADACEAAVRSLAKAPPGRIEGLIRKIVKDRLDDGQLEDSPLTLQDLNRIAEVFSRVLSGSFHRRIEYPEWVLHELRGPRSKNGKPQNARANPGAKPSGGALGGRTRGGGNGARKVV
jgi:putative nucleotidyltransferase with HDIG domain